MGSGIDREELRQLVRDVLRSSLAGERAAAVSQPPGNLIEAIRQAIEQNAFASAHASFLSRYRPVGHALNG